MHQNDDNYRNVQLTSTRLLVQQWYTHEAREAVEWGDEISYIWRKGGYVDYRDPTRAEVLAWLEAHPEPMADRDITLADLTAWGRSMMGGDTSDMVDT